jgi:hypothetical protein
MLPTPQGFDRKARGVKCKLSDHGKIKWEVCGRKRKPVGPEETYTGY